VNDVPLKHAAPPVPLLRVRYIVGGRPPAQATHG
jgi:hypothetical protein